jgi:hypothetical protein
MDRVSYTREQLISFYAPDLPLPENIAKVSRAFQAEPTVPILCQAHQTLEYHPAGHSGAAPQVRRDIAPKPKPGAAQPRFAAPAKPAASAGPPASTVWFYLDAQQTIQGPYDSERLNRWWEQKKLPPDLQISTSNDTATFRQVGTYFPDLSLAFTYNPILFPFLGPIDVDPEDPLEQIFCDFEAKIESQ